MFDFFTLPHSFSLCFDNMPRPFSDDDTTYTKSHVLYVIGDSYAITTCHEESSNRVM